MGDPVESERGPDAVHQRPKVGPIAPTTLRDRAVKLLGNPLTLVLITWIAMAVLLWLEVGARTP